MAEFTPITTQEEFDSMIKSRLERERNTISKQFEEKLAGYADYDQLKENVQNLTNEKASWESTVNEKAEQIKTLEDQLADANSKVKSYELDNFRTSAAVANNIPFELRNRITGDTEEAINEDAKNWPKYSGHKTTKAFRDSSRTRGISRTITRRREKSTKKGR